MTNWNSWMIAAKAIDRDFDTRLSKSTPETYSRIRDLGLQTVVWLSFSPSNNSDVESMLNYSRDFLKKHSPCLFIWDPRKNGQKKNFLMDINDPKTIEDWLMEKNDLAFDYSYLLTSQVINPGDGFVGSVFSNGQGRMLFETMHLPGICNQRLLSQQRGNDSNQTFFTTDCFESGFVRLESLEGRFLSRDAIYELIETYVSKKGYFEFIKGVHLGTRGVFTTGYENVTFPVNVHTAQATNMSFRLNGLYRDIGNVWIR